MPGIIAAFCTFGLVLAWGEYQTRHLDRQEHEREPATENDDLKRAA